VDVGFDRANLLTVTLSLPTDRYPAAARVSFFDALTRAVASMPGVRNVTTAGGPPPSGGGLHFTESLEAEGGVVDTHTVILPDTAVAGNYFSTLGIPIVEGRAFRPDDARTDAIVSRSMAKKLWPGASPLGRRFRVFATAPWLTVVGVAGEVRQGGFADREGEMEMYTPLWTPVTAAPAGAVRRATTRGFAQLTMIVRADNPMAIVPAIKSAVWAIDRDQPIGAVALVEHLLDESIREQRFALVLMTAFAGLALLLAGAGLYAVLSHTVLQRRQEIGIRVALGARRIDVLNLIVSRGMALTLAGVSAGLVAAYALSRYIASQLYEVSAHDPLSFAAVAVALTAIALLACWVPTRRALRIDPAVALRLE
jgi:putative ABC transport system permease protein